MDNASEIAADTEHGIEERARFTAMENGTQEDWAIIGRDYFKFAAGLPDRSVVAGTTILGDAIVRAEEATLIANRVQGPFVVLGVDPICADNLAFLDHDGDGTMADQGEVLGRLGCEPNGLRYKDP